MNIYSYIRGVIMKSEAEQCKACCINPGGKYFQQKHQIILEAETQILAEFFRIFGDVTRLKILQAVAKEELCVCDIYSEYGTISRITSIMNFTQCQIGALSQ